MEYCQGEENCEKNVVNKCEFCEDLTCDFHGDGKYCNICDDMFEEIDEYKQKKTECYFAKCKTVPEKNCVFCDRKMCSSHKCELDKCVRCYEAIKKLKTDLKQYDSWQREEIKDTKKLDKEYYQSYLLARRYGDSCGFWFHYTPRKND